MPTLDELLNSSNEVATCTVNPDTREIIVPEKYKILGVFSDEKVTRIPFTCPKVVGNNVDLTEYNLYINYQNSIGRHNAYLVDDIAVSGDNITFSWLLSRDVTLSSGVVKYSICAKKLNGDSISNEWNTTIANGVVIQGLEATQAIVEENSDIIEAILSKAHTHANKSMLDKFAESNGKPTYDGKALGGSPNAVLYTEQTITDAQKKQARENIDAASSDFVINGTLNDEALTVDKTYAQIQEAVQAGKSAVLKVKVYGVDFVLPLIGKSSSSYLFTAAATVFPTVTIKFTAVVGESETSWYTERVVTCDSDGKIEQFSMDRDPSQPMEVATKQYVDNNTTGGAPITIKFGTGHAATSTATFAEIKAALEAGKAPILDSALGISHWFALNWMTIGSDISDILIIQYGTFNVDGGGLANFTLYDVSVSSTGITYASRNFSTE